MAIVQPRTATEKLRVATHGRSMWQIDLTTTPTAVSVQAFGARRTGSTVQVSWRTASESRIAGFNVWRNGVKLNRAVIRAKHSGRPMSATYSYVDRSGQAGRPSTYRLEVVDLRGKRAWFARTAAVR